MKNFHFNTICNITQEPQLPQELLYNCVCGLFGKSAVIKKNRSSIAGQKINRKLHFDQLATASYSTSP